MKHVDADGEAIRILAERATRAERERDEARAALALAYPRALRAAADVVLAADLSGFYVEDAEALELLDSLANAITDLTPEDIERISKEHGHE